MSGLKNKVSYHLRLTDLKEWEQFKKLAKRENRSANQKLNQLIKDFVKANEHRP